MNNICLLSTLLLLLSTGLSWGQYAPAAGQAGSTAIPKDSSIFIAWANSCQVERGPLDIRNPNGGDVTNGTAVAALGKAGDGSVLSLGDGGQATLTFMDPISNGAGADFAIFENSFSATFLELAFVEVSSDGVNFVRFPAVSNTDTTTQIGSFGAIDATQIYNLAGKYKANYGTPFDLEELEGDSAILDINRVTHIRVIDVVGCIQDNYATRDSRGVKVNDPWTTPFPSGGFDLDAVGVIHNTSTVAVNNIANPDFVISPNPVSKEQAIIHIQTNLHHYTAYLYTTQGQVIELSKNTNQLYLPNDLSSGIYILSIQTAGAILTKKIQVY